MADNKMPDSSVNNSIADYIETMSLDAEGTLKSIDLTLKAIARQDGLVLSQSTLKDLVEQERRAANNPRNNSAANRQTNNNQQRSTYTRGEDTYRRQSRRKSPTDLFDEAADEFEKQFKQALFDSESPILDALQEPLKGFAEKLGTDINGIGKKVGENLGKAAGNAFKDSTIGKRLTEEWKSIGNFITDSATDFLNSAGDILSDPEAIRNLDMSDVLNRGASTLREAYEKNFTGFQTSMEDVWSAVRGRRPQPNTEDVTESNASSIGDVVDVFTNITDVESGMTETVDSIIEMGQSGSQAAETLAGLPGAAGQAEGALSIVSQGAASLGGELPAIAGAAGATGTSLSTLVTTMGPASAAFPMLTVGLLGLVAVLPLVEGALGLLVDAVKNTFQPLIDGAKSFGDALHKAGNRVQTQNKKNLQLWQNRVEADTKSVVEASFNVITESAERAMQAWDNVLQVVTSAQGYTKEGVQDLWSNYAERLRSEGLSSYVSSADIMSNLESVLKQGLSGDVAEEFAYIATKLNAAIPTQDFFQYASTYASIAANAMKNGASQADALQTANEELANFASNLLYASRQIAGGFSSNISKGAQLFEDSAKIALSSQKETSVSDISGVLTSVSAIISATAPDLADSLVQAVVDAAIGGNSDTITALRSMSGVGASNSAFLNALASDPQKVFSTLFSNLANLQGMSSENYMEVADALASVFGLSRDAFARVDFAYLADAISAMNVNNDDLNKNLELLQSGQTTASAEQLRIQKLNEYMVEEGLAYVLDNEVARELQKHMWDEQLAREIEETTFAVELQGGALEFLQGISQTVANIVNFINPLSWAKGVGNVVLTAIEAAQQRSDIQKIVEEGVIGKGNSEAFRKLAGGNGPDNLHLNEDYLSLLSGGTQHSGVAAVRGVQQLWNALSGQQSVDKSSSIAAFGLAGYAVNQIGQAVGKSIQKILGDNRSKSTPTSYYTTKLIDKSTTSAYAKSGNWTTDIAGYNALYAAKDEETKYLAGDDPKKSAEQRGKDVAEAMQKSMTDYLSSPKVSKLLNPGKDQIDTIMAVAESNLGTDDDKNKNLYRYFETNTLNKEGATYLSQQEILDRLREVDISEGEQVSFDAWVKEYTKGTMTTDELAQVLSNYGSDINTIRAKFEENQSKEASKQSKARELHEVRFWEDMQRFATDLFPEYLNEWKRYYIAHEAYTQATQNAYIEAFNMQQLEKNETGNSVLKLAEALTNNDIWGQLGDAIKDPQVQTNALLAQILIVAEAIMQQNNETSIVSVPTALTALSLGISNTSGKATTSTSTGTTTTVASNANTGVNVGGGRTAYTQ